MEVIALYVFIFKRKFPLCDAKCSKNHQKRICLNPADAFQLKNSNPISRNPKFPEKKN